MRLYQIIVPLVGLVGIAFTLRQFRTGINTFFESALWTILWLFISLVAIFPDAITFFLSKSIGIKDHINGIIFIGLAISFFLNFKLFNSFKKQNKIITDLVRKIALDKQLQGKEKE
jgi:hypothetical protein